jgi:ATP-dependent helicase/nuclease subunit A
VPKRPEAEEEAALPMTLTREQLLAAEATGSVAVTAGAGTGKTRMLAERYLFHVRDQGFSPLAVVAVTFTEKAAAELRSRIRTTLSGQISDQDIIAEVEAAQISTIHALAARICRNFHELAGIAADFAVLDETESPLWFGEKFAEAISQLSIEIVDGIGRRKLIWLLQELLKDPIASDKALSRDPDTWEEMLEQAKEAAKKTLLASAEWSDVSTIVSTCSGTGLDKLEEIRSGLHSLLTPSQAGVDLDALSALLKSFRSNSGGAKNWDPDVLTKLRRCIASFKMRVSTATEICALGFTQVDADLAERLPLLRAAFDQTREYIAHQKIKEKVLDFNDLEHYALKILEHDEALRYYRIRWKAFLIDEFQDTNPVQADIIRRLSEGAIVSVVGDEKQSIYGFRGADLEVFNRVRDEIVGNQNGLEVVLDRTFRAHHELIVNVNELFQPVLGELHQELVAERQESDHSSPFIRLAAVEEKKGSFEVQRRVLEGRYIAEQISELHERGVAYSDIAILCRRWEPLNLYLDVLSAQEIPAVNAGGGSLLSTIEARDIYALLQFASDLHDDIALVSVLRSPFFAFDDRTLYRAALSWTEGVSWWDMIRTDGVFAAAVETLQEILKVSRSRSAETIVRVADKLTGYSAVVANLPQGPRKLADLEGVFDVLRKLAVRGRGDVFGVVRYLRELYSADIALPRPAVDPGDAVVLMTIHRAKGLEWPVVFVPDLSSSTSGGSSSILVDPDLGVAFKLDDDEPNPRQEPVIYGLIRARRRARELEEARRILYVAITRARDKVFLTAGRDKGYDIDILRPGIEASGIALETIPFVYENTVAPAPGSPPLLVVPATVDLEPVSSVLSELPVTALSVYATCPARFRWQFIEQHPGVYDEAGSAMQVGTLTHLALEKDITTTEKLGDLVPEAGIAEVERAISFANAFRGSAFDKMRGEGHLKEHGFVEDFGPIRLHGVADLVGDAFVLDYKTDAHMDPAIHRFQLWAYAKALKKKRAYIAYLAHDKLHEFTEDELAAIEVEAAELLTRLASGAHSATPSPQACRFCAYKEVCEFRYLDEIDDDSN